MSEDSRRERLAELKEEATSLIELQRCSDEARIANAIKIGRVLTEAKKLIKQGSFGMWCRREIGYEKSQRVDTMRVFDYRNELRFAQEWAVVHGIPAVTVSDISKMLPKWRRRDDPTPSPSTPRRRNVGHLTEHHRSLIRDAHTALEATGVSGDAISLPERVIFRLVVACNVAPDRLWKAAGLKAPAVWSARIEQEAFGSPAASCDVSKAMTPAAPDTTIGAQSACSDPTEGADIEAIAINISLPSSAKVGHPQGSRPSSASHEVRPSTSWHKVSNRAPASRLLREKGLKTIMRYGRLHETPTRISYRLKVLDLKVSARDVRAILLPKRA